MNIAMPTIAWLLATVSVTGKLVDLEEFIPGIVIDLKYATSDNFTGQIVYPFQRCLLQEEAAIRLKEVWFELQEEGIGLKVFDGFRPMAAQWKFWGLVPDERYVSDPRKGGRHTRGTAVDVTLIDSGGREFPMPSSFDCFDERAHRSYQGGTPEETASREKLQKVMEKHGFEGLPSEWWHFDLIGWERFPPVEDSLE